MKLKEKPVYLDVCALGRPYDDQSFARIRIEKIAVDVIIASVKYGRYTLYYSDVHEMEIAANPDEIARLEIIELLHKLGKNAAPSVKESVLGSRVKQLYQKGFESADAFHVAYAENLGASFITCDDKLLRRCHRTVSEIWCGTPDDFCRKERLI